jgi:hypothetical protein
MALRCDCDADLIVATPKTESLPGCPISTYISLEIGILCVE